MADLVVTIDGPAASGKSTVARLLAKRLGASFLDTGAMYRAVTLAALRSGLDMGDEEDLLEVMNTRRFEFEAGEGGMSVFIDGDDVTELIRSPEVTAESRHIASAPRVREKLVAMQREFAASQKHIVTEGRDQGTVAFADADVKFYLTAGAGERARRRFAELQSRGVDESLESVRRAIEARDSSDTGRSVGPLKPAGDAIVVDTTDMGVEEVVDKVAALVRERWSKSE